MGIDHHGGIIKGNYNKVVLLRDVGAVIWRRRRESAEREERGRFVEEGRIERLSQFARKTNWNFNRPPYPTALNAPATLPANPASLSRDATLANLRPPFPASPSFFPPASLRTRAKCFYARRYYVPLSLLSSCLFLTRHRTFFSSANAFSKKTDGVIRCSFSAHSICNLVESGFVHWHTAWNLRKCLRLGQIWSYVNNKTEYIVLCQRQPEATFISEEL